MGQGSTRVRVRTGWPIAANNCWQTREAELLFWALRCDRQSATDVHLRVCLWTSVLPPESRLLRRLIFVGRTSYPSRSLVVSVGAAQRGQSHAIWGFTGDQGNCTKNGVIGNYEELVTRSLCPCQLVINRNALTSNLPQGLLG
jgi:hypothetical protein